MESTMKALAKKVSKGKKHKKSPGIERSRKTKRERMISLTTIQRNGGHYLQEKRS
jgi:hypothetical protein